MRFTFLIIRCAITFGIVAARFAFALRVATIRFAFSHLATLRWHARRYIAMQPQRGRANKRRRHDMGGSER